ncbi:hypothetical protein PCC7418_2794 [Halothece sp. PCC 7418]|uniref:hypothetical protein n=1 Tax=Halothece sp. (strain PCC 7418) TaxID=65093 RepID=UPI0002A06C2D|nr:hypothetical protein [Halothece sp. PCC 7418]AFZ44927.1 hypothetical protein PCC7418_2794 [Halothece sp. PCC 7418]
MKSLDSTCSLSILVARTDIPFIMHTIPHLVRMCNYNFLEKCLIVDTAPLSGKFKSRPGIGSLSELRDCCEKLVQKGIIDRLIDIDYSKETIKKLYHKHFGSFIKHTHNYRGYPIYGSIFAIEAVKGDYILHFDSDMLLHQKTSFNWIAEGMQLLEKNDQVMFVSPLSGPPTEDGSLQQRGVDYKLDKDGFYKFQDFTSRKYLLKKEKFDSFLPMEPAWISWKRRLASVVTGNSPLWNWEIMVSKHLQKTGKLRADLASPQAWTLHTPDHGKEFIDALPNLICKIESGHYPKEQAGNYDLDLKLWRSTSLLSNSK